MSNRARISFKFSQTLRSISGMEIESGGVRELSSAGKSIMTVARLLPRRKAAIMLDWIQKESARREKESKPIYRKKQNNVERRSRECRGVHRRLRGVRIRDCLFTLKQKGGEEKTTHKIA